MKRSRLARGLASALLLSALTCAGELRAAPPAEKEAQALTDKAAALYDEGVALVKKKQFAAARASFLAAWALKQHWQVAANLADCEMQLALWRPAAEHAAFYLKHAPADRRPRAEALMKAITAKLMTVKVQVEPAGAEVVVDGVTIGRAPLEGAVYLEPGPRVLAAKVPGRPEAEQKIEAVAGGTGEVALVVPDAPAPASAAGGADGAHDAAQHQGAIAPPPGSGLAGNDEAAGTAAKPAWRVPVMIGGAGVAAVGLGLGLGFTVASNAAASDADALLADVTRSGGPSACHGGGSDPRCAELASLNGSSDARRDVAVVGFVIGGVGAAAAAVAALWPAGRGGAGSVHAAPAVGGGLRGVVVHGTF